MDRKSLASARLLSLMLNDVSFLQPYRRSKIGLDFINPALEIVTKNWE